MGEGMIAMSFQELLSNLDAKTTLTRDRTLALARALESLNIGIEPDVLGGAKLPKADENVVLFSVPPGEVVSRSTPAYQAAVLTLDLASAVAAADGEPVVVKQAPDAFHGTELGRLVDEAGRGDLVIAGFMTHMCVAFTTAGAFLRGNRPTVVADACATRALPVNGTELDAQGVHLSALATIADLYGVVVPSQEELGR
jgi:isochorismate hydrolase